MSVPDYRFQVEFLGFIQRILGEGSFVATYKFALLMALADLAVEQGDDTDAGLELHVHDIARKFLGYYDRQALPFVGAGSIGEIHQNTGPQAAIVNAVREAQAVYEFQGPAGVERLVQSPGLLSRVAQIVRIQPLWKLQTFANERVDFLYPNLDRGNLIVLRPGIAACFRRFHGIVHRLAQDAWIRSIRQLRQNQVLLGDKIDLHAFMFGQVRRDLAPYRELLSELQQGECFYCGHPHRRGEVDHFIPWSLYGTDLGHNFVLACGTCNRRKRDFLAGIDPLDRWLERNEEHAGVMAEYFHRRGLHADVKGTRMIARWAYQRVDDAKALVWAGDSQYHRLDTSWRARFDPAQPKAAPCPGP